MRDLQKTSDDLLARANRGEKRAMAKLLHLDDLPLLAKYARQRLASA